MAGQRPSPRLLPGNPSHLCLLRQFKGVINFNAQISHGAFQLAVPEQELHRAKVFGAPVSQRCFGAARGVRANPRQRCSISSVCQYENLGKPQTQTLTPILLLPSADALCVHVTGSLR